jgi:F420-dependent oxidoreductase-like protein
MLLGIQIPDFTWPGAPATIGPTFRGIARDADQAGLASLWVMDHFFQISVVGPPENEMLDGWLTLAHAAAVTERITLGTMVTGVTYRHPGLLVKGATTLDVLSGGRAWFGIGAAWNEEEHRGLGVPYPPTAERFERLEETLRIALQMWAGDEQPFHGTHYTLERPLNSPPPISAPHPKILVGGMGEKKTLRLVAQYADACNLFDIGVDGLRAKLAVLDGHCADVGRDPAQIERTVLGHYGPYAELGIDQVIVSGPPVTDTGLFDELADLREQLGAIGVK